MMRFNPSRLLCDLQSGPGATLIPQISGMWSFSIRSLLLRGVKRGEHLTQNLAWLLSAYEDATAGMEKERLSGFHSQLECEAVGGTDAAKRSPVMDSLVFCWLEDPVLEAANTFSCARGISLSRYRGWILWNHAPELMFDHPWCYWASSGVPDFKCLRLHPECT